MKFSFNNILLILACISLFLFEKAEMFPAASISNQGGYIVLLVPITLTMSFFLLYLTNQKYVSSNPLLRSFSTFLIAIYIFALLTGGFDSKSQYIFVFLPICVVWGASGQGGVNYKAVEICVISVFLGLVQYFFYNYPLYAYEEIKTQNIGAYSLMYFLPLILCLKNRLLRIAGIVIILVALLFSLKRGGLVSFALAIITYWLVYAFFYRNNRFRFRYFLIVIFVLAGLSYSYVYFDQLSDNILSSRFQGIQADGGSGRSRLYPTVWSHIVNSDVSELVLGHGWDAVRKNCGNNLSAHNDFLEILYNFGLIVFSLYILFYVKFLKNIRILLKKRSPYAASMCSTFVLFFVMSLVSHIVVYSKYVVLFALYFGLSSYLQKSSIFESGH